MSEDPEAQTLRPPADPLVVEYCPNCKLPFEYCEFSSDWKTCSANLEKVDAELLQKLKDLRIASGKDKPSANAGTESKSAEATKKPAKTADGEGEEEDGEEGEDDENGDEEDEEEEVAEVVKSPAATMKAGKPGVKEITITVKERTRRKFMTIVKGVETCGLKSKDIAKEFSKKFATSASVTADGIMLNGDLQTDIADYLLDQYSSDVPATALYSIDKAGKKSRLGR